uniref:Immunoglobulin domain-containing protein n=1 Tax=Anopheles epiroticus TaxID=199890 RepID=A0A182PIW9_9DIPT
MRSSPLITFRVAWMHFEQSAILTVHNHVITRNPRISVTHDKHDKHKTWFLHITNVQEEDKGRYMCQINTVAAKTQFGYLHVVVWNWGPEREMIEAIV